MDEGDVRHSTRAGQVADPNYRFARRGRSRAGGYRLHLVGSLVAPTARCQAAAPGGIALCRAFEDEQRNRSRRFCRCQPNRDRGRGADCPRLLAATGPGVRLKE
jgi:hypothetical protein